MPAPASNAAPASVGLLAAELRCSLRRVFRIATWSALALAIGTVLFLAVGIATSSWRLLPVLSGSMEPAFGRGDAVLVERVPLSSVRAGDVIAYHVPVGDRQLTTHRVVSILERGERPVVRTKGDANAIADPWDARLSGDGLWRVEATLPAVGHAYVLAASPRVRTVLLWLAVAACAGILVRRLWRPEETGARASA